MKCRNVELSTHKRKEAPAEQQESLFTFWDGTYLKLRGT